MTKSRKQSFLHESGVVLAVLVVGSLLFRTADLDLRISHLGFAPENSLNLAEAKSTAASGDKALSSKRFVSRGGSEWLYYDNAWARFFYTYGPYPALITALSALLVFAAGFVRRRLLPYRRIALFLFLTLLVGPGLLVNSVFKEFWGRPRPRDTVEFGGKWAFVPLGDTVGPGKGKSFPSGHASMGFYFLTFYFLFRNKRRKWACLVFAASVLYGSLLGVVRIVQGGHFASDVFWSAGFVYLTAMLLFFLLKLDVHPDPTRGGFSLPSSRMTLLPPPETS